MKQLLAAVVLTLALSPALAEDAPYVLKPDRTLATVLSDFAGKSVTLYLHGGKEVSGKLSVVGSHAVQLSELRGKEFFDAVIELDEIAALEFRSRSR